MNRAFLSHSSKQKELIRIIASNIGRDQCIFDEYEFEAGMPLYDNIIRGLKSCDVFVFFLSNDALNSDWVQTEITETKNLMDNDPNKHFLPILIDNSLNISEDQRIPTWVKKYLLNPITDPFIIVKKIRQNLRERLIEKNPIYKEKSKLFIGRQELFDQFEANLYSVTKINFKSIIVSGFEGVGRRSFLRNALIRDNRMKDYYEPIYISLDSKDSIESLILQLITGDKKELDNYLKQLSECELDEKIEIAYTLLNEIQKNNEYIFIIDSGCIIKPTKQIADWFIELIKKDLKRIFTLNIISRFRPSNDSLKKNKDLLYFNVSNLSEKDSSKLFFKYSKLLNIDLTPEQSIEVLQLFNGIPGQIYETVDQINNYGINDVLRNKNNIIEYGDIHVYNVIEDIKNKGENYYNILVLISNFDFISYDFLYSIIGNSEEINDILEYFFITGIYDHIGNNKEYLKVQYPISDYINRSKSKIKTTHKAKLKSNITDFIKEPDRYNYTDISELFYNIKGALINGHKLPDKYYIPSFILKTILELYYLEKYENVMSIIYKILENSRRLDPDIKREFIYWLCLSLARLKDKRFETVVKEIDGADYFYLFGFYYRINKQLDLSEKCLKMALEKSPNFQRAKRELVNVYLLKSNYIDSLDLAKSNYENQKLNSFHIQAFFICLIKKRFLSKTDILIIEELLKNITKSFDHKAQEIASIMNAEYQFYIKKDPSKAIILLKECIKNNKKSFYAKKALLDIYKKSMITEAEHELNLELEKNYDNSFL